MHTSMKLAMALSLAAMLLPAMAQAAAAGTSLPPGAPQDSSAADHSAQADNSKPFPENFIPMKPIHKLWCFNGSLIGKPGVFYYENMGDVLKKGSQVEITFQPGNKKLLLTVPTDLKLWWAIPIPAGTLGISPRMTCSAIAVVVVP